MAILNTSGATLVGVLPGDTVTLNTSASTGTFANKSVGNGKTVTVSGLAIGGPNASKYFLLQPTTTASITAKALTVTGITAASRTYDGTATASLNTAGATLVGVVSGDAVTLNTSAATGTFADKTVGNNKTVSVAGLTIGGGDANNYSLSQPTTTASISPKALTVTGISASDKVYDGTTVATLNVSTGSLQGVIAGDAVTLNTSGASGAFADKNVGVSKPVTTSGFTIINSDAGNYSLSLPTLSASITPKPITVADITANNKTYDGTSLATLNLGGASLQGTVSGDAVSLVSASASGSFADRTSEQTRSSRSLDSRSVAATLPITPSRSRLQPLTSLQRRLPQT